MIAHARGSTPAILGKQQQIFEQVGKHIYIFVMHMDALSHAYQIHGTAGTQKLGRSRREL